MSAAIVNTSVAADDTGPDDYGLEVGQVVEVVGFINGTGGSPYAVVVSNGRYVSLPAWYLDPLPQGVLVG